MAAAGKHPLVSIIIPVFDDEAGVSRCLAALGVQTYPLSCLEVILVDNGSTPALSVANHLPYTVQITRHEKPGSYSARNAGARIATGEILAFTDADCVPQRGWVEQGVHALQEGHHHHLVGGEVVIAPPSVRSGVGLYQYAAGFRQKENIENKEFSVTANLFCTKGQFQHIGPFDERLLSGGDREWSWRAKKLGLPMVYAPGAIVYTEPRTSLGAAIRQTRRVAAGRYHLRSLQLGLEDVEGLRPHRRSLASLSWILCYPSLTRWERLKVLTAALVLKAFALTEMVRLKLGGSAERR